MITMLIYDSLFYRLIAYDIQTTNDHLQFVKRNTLIEVYALSALKILWDFGVVCLNAPK